MLQLLSALLVVPLTVPASAQPPRATGSVSHRDPSQSLPTQRLRETPTSVHRRAVEILEERREAYELGWSDATLAPAVVPMFRPGEVDPAYYEFTVLGRDATPVGYLVLSSGEHDHPLVHLAAGPAPSARLATRRTSGTTIAKVYRFGYEGFAAEDAAGHLLAVEGQLPAKVQGYDPTWLDRPAHERRGRYRWDPERGVQHERAEVGEGVTFEAWPSWEALVAGYAENRAALHEVDRRAAADDWAAERALEANGGTLQNREFREFPLLADRGDASFVLSGAGASAVRVEQVERPLERDLAIRVWVEHAPADEVVPIDIAVKYGDGTTETLRLNVTETIPTDVLGRVPTAVLGAAAPTASVTVRVEPLAGASGIACAKAALQTQWDTYVSLDGTALRTDAPFRTNDSLFRIEHQEVGKVAFRAPNGLYVRAVDAGGGDLIADRPTAGGHEWFTVYANRADAKYYGLQTANRRNFVGFSWSGGVDARATKDNDSKFTVDYCMPRRLYRRWAGNDIGDVVQKVRKYAQLGANQAPSTSQCSSGCGATAWGMLFGYHDYEASRGDAKWLAHKMLYRQDGSTNGPDAVAPEFFFTEGRGPLGGGRTPDAGVAKMVWELSQIMNDWTVAGCGPSGKWTAPVEMGKAHIYLDRRGVKAPLKSDYDGAGIMTHEGKTKAYGVIKKKQPVVIGIGSLSHYPLAVGRDRAEYRVWNRGSKRWSGWADRKHFVVSMGWGDTFVELVPYDTWMQGWLDVPEVVQAVTEVNTTIDPPKPAPLPQPKNPILPQPTSPLPGGAPLPGSKLPTK